MPQIAQVVKSTFRINHIGGNCPFTLSNTTTRGDFTAQAATTVSTPSSSSNSPPIKLSPDGLNDVREEDRDWQDSAPGSKTLSSTSAISLSLVLGLGSDAFGRGLLTLFQSALSPLVTLPFLCFFGTPCNPLAIGKS